MQIIETEAAIKVFVSGAGPALEGSAVLVGVRLGSRLLSVLAATVDVDRIETVGTGIVVELVVGASLCSNSFVIEVVACASGVEVKKKGRPRGVMLVEIESASAVTTKGEGVVVGCVEGIGTAESGGALAGGVIGGLGGSDPPWSVISPSSSVSSPGSTSRLNPGRSGI